VNGFGAWDDHKARMFAYCEQTSFVSNRNVLGAVGLVTPIFMSSVQFSVLGSAWLTDYGAQLTSALRSLETRGRRRVTTCRRSTVQRRRRICPRKHFHPRERQFCLQPSLATDMRRLASSREQDVSIATHSRTRNKICWTK
jgi:hypothetical protein